jgi:hypothetical protein
MFNKNKSTSSESRAIILTSVNDPNDIKLCYGLRPCIRFLKEKEKKGFPYTKETLIKYIIMGKPYHGYFCKFV